MRQVQEALRDIGIPVIAGVWRATSAQQNPPAQYCVYSTTTTEAAHEDDHPSLYRTYVYLNLWSDIDPTEMRLRIRRAMYDAGFGIPSPGHRPKWSAQSVRSILSNEKYKGDALLQKSFTVDFLSKKKKKNEGELPSFYVTGNHEGIVSPEVFDMVQTELARRKPGKNRHSGIHVFSGIVYCDHCGSLFGSKVWHSNDQYRRVIWQCNHKYAGDEVCPTPHVDEKHLTDAFLSALNKILPNQKAIRKTVEGVIATALNTDELSRQREELLAEMEVVNQMIADGIRENASVVQDQDEYEKRYKMLCDRTDGIKAKCNILESQIEDRSTRRGAIEHFLTALERQAAPVAEFDPAAFHLLTERMTVHENGHITIQFKDGTEITE